MTVRIRKLVGAVALILLVVVWSLLAMAVAQFMFRSADSVSAWFFYAIAGLGWVLLAMPIVSWMHRSGRKT